MLKKKDVPNYATLILQEELVDREIQAESITKEIEGAQSRLASVQSKIQDLKNALATL